MKKTVLTAGVAIISLLALGSCGKKSEANREQIENARQEAVEMTKDYDASKSMKPGSDKAAAQKAAPESAEKGKVVINNESSTEIIVSEVPAPDKLAPSK